jgi:16S rRNA (uracil1498-N3)-methyltransferase
MHYLIQKSTELGIRTLQPITTEHTVVHKINYDRLRANAIEAAEQCGRTCLPEVKEIRPLKELLANWNSEHPLIFCDESGGGTPVNEALANTTPPLGILIGPEGGFSKSELETLHQKPYVTPIGLGPRILRADTAAIASISCIMSLCGDWNKAPKFEAS